MNFLYNGVVLPNIDNVWADKDTYKYAYLCSNDGAYFLVLAVERHGVTDVGYLNHTFGSESEILIYKLENNEWATDETLRTSIPGLFWASEDTFYVGGYGDLSGTLYLPASDPIPVGSAPEVEPKSLMLGWLVGQKVRSIVSSLVGRKPYLTFSSSEPFTLSKNSTSKPWDGTLYYSTDAQTWSEWDGTTTLSSSDTNTIYMRGSGNSVITNGYNYNSKWVLSGNNIQCYGNIETLLDYEIVEAGGHPVMADRCFACMFYDCAALVTPPELPATTLINKCYDSMFRGCSNLTKAPKLPATVLENACYTDMFYGCTGLVEAPELPATILANYCYSGMFRGCSNLSKAPELPAETLTRYCYENMFYECTSLTQAPKLPATTLAIYCYYYMFKGCTSLTTAPELPATSLADYCYYTMFYDCTSLVQAPKLPATALTKSCYRSMFCGCTGLLTPPELPATSLADFCYYEMFRRCTNLITLPKLCATTLYSSCYSRMFWDCTSIKISATATDEYQNSYRIPISGTGVTAESALANMFYNTGGTLSDTPTINTTYYTSNTVV